MKRFTALVVFMGLIITLCCLPVNAESYNVDNNENLFLKFKIDQSNFSVNGVSYNMDPGVSPVIIQSRTLIPIRFATEPLGATIGWDPNEWKVTIKLFEKTIEMWIGNNVAKINGSPVSIDPGNPEVKPLIVNSRTMLPIRFIAENLGVSVQWKAETEEVLLTRLKLPLITHFEKTDGINYAVLGNGRKYQLLDPLDNAKYMNLFPDTDYEIPDEILREIEAPNRVDLREFQTPIRNQGGRGTCTVFATLAGIEARYKHMDLAKYNSLDLSEQYANYIQKTVHLKSVVTSNATLRENQLGRWGGGTVDYLVNVFSKLYRIPEESFKPYDPSSSYENTAERLDDPFIDYNDPSVTQILINNTNYVSSEFSQTALENAKYGIDSFAKIPDGELRNPAYYERILASGHEIIVGLTFHGPEPTPGDNIWDPGTTPGGNHAVVLVGYDRNQRIFIVKNSWGYSIPEENGFNLMSYDYITRGHVGDGAYIIEVTSEDSYAKEQLFLGRWKLSHDGWKGTLDIYRQPELFGGSETDRRIGTYFHEDGSVHRVNGSITGNRLYFCIDFEQPNINYADIRGKIFDGYIYSWNNKMIAGTFSDRGVFYGFYATKDNYLVNTAQDGELGYGSYMGIWSMNHDGWQGTLKISGIRENGEIIGAYTANDGTNMVVTGAVNYSNKREITIRIPFDPNNPQVFKGYMHSWDHGIISGYTTWDGNRYGFTANRMGDLPDYLE